MKKCKIPSNPECWSSAEIGRYYNEFRDADVTVVAINIDVPFERKDAEGIVKSWMKNELGYTDERIEKDYGVKVKIDEIDKMQQRIIVLVFGKRSPRSIELGLGPRKRFPSDF